MPSVKRRQVYAIRNAISDVEAMIPKTDRSQVAEWERDLSATACVALWELDVYRLVSCLRRLSEGSKERKNHWQTLYSLVCQLFSLRSACIAQSVGLTLQAA
jgi:hypothetical protein